jgi:hypothetical protein
VPINYSIDATLGLLTYTLSGVVTDAEYLAAAARAGEDALFASCPYHLSDQRGVERFDVTAAGLGALAKFIERHWVGRFRRWRLAVVAPRDISYGMARMYQQIRGDSYEAIAIFRELEPARQWLLGEDPAHRLYCEPGHRT